MKGVLFCRCSAKVYVSGKLEAKARDCVYLGKDPNTPGFLVQLLGGKKTGKEVRTAQVITFFPEDFPYTHSTIPIPDKIKPCVYESDSDQEEDGIKIEDGVELQQSDSIHLRMKEMMETRVKRKVMIPCKVKIRNQRNRNKWMITMPRLVKMKI